MTRISWAEMSLKTKEQRDDLLDVCRRVLRSLESNLTADCLPETKALLREAIAKVPVTTTTEG